MKLFCIITMQGGQPNIDQTVTPYTGFVLCDQVGNYGAYLVSGTGAQLTAINALPQVLGICSVTESGTTKWAELDNTVSAAIQTKLNNWTAANHPSWPTVQANNTYRQILTFLFKKFNTSFDLSLMDVSDGS